MRSETLTAVEAQRFRQARATQRFGSGRSRSNAKTGFETSLQLIESIGLRQQRRARDEHGNHSACCALAGGVKHFQIGTPFDGPPRQIETGVNLERLRAASRFISGVVGHPLTSKAYQAMEAADARAVAS